MQPDKFKLVKEQVEEVQKAADSLSSDDEMAEKDSVYDDDDKDKCSWHIEDLSRKGRKIKIGSKVKLMIKDVTVTEGTLISHAEMY